MKAPHFLGPAFGPDGPEFVETLEGRRGVPRATHKRVTAVVVDDLGNAVMYRRRCPDCLRWQPLDFEHFATRGDGHALGMQSRCIACSSVRRELRRKRDPEGERARQREGYRRRMADPEYRDWWLAQVEQARRRRVARDPERERVLQRARRKRYMARLRADPERHGEYLELRRIETRLRSERRGRDLESIRSLPAANGYGSDRIPRELFERVGGAQRSFLPVAPLLPIVRARVVKLMEEGVTVAEACERCGTHERLYRAWLGGERDGVTEDVATSVLAALDVEWWDVWVPTPDTLAA